MAKKFAAIVACVVLLLSVIPFTASAADSAAFKICTVSQDSKSIVVTLDFVKGTGFSAFDASIEYNNLKLTLEDCQFASGFAAFKEYLDKEGGATIFNANMNVNPVKVSIATTIPFKAIDKDGSILKLRFSKIEGANISEADIVLTIDNCQNEEFKDIKTSVSYDLSNGSSSSLSDATVEAGLTPEESAEKATSSTQAASGADVTDKSAQSTENVQNAQNGGEEESTVSSVNKTASAAKGDKGISNSKKTVVIIVISALCLAGIGFLAYVFKKNKKSPADLDD